MGDQTFRFLNGDEVRKACPMEEAVEAMKGAFQQLSAGNVTVPQRTVLSVGEQGEGVALFMPVYGALYRQVGLKFVTLEDLLFGRLRDRDDRVGRRHAGPLHPTRKVVASTQLLLLPRSQGFQGMDRHGERNPMEDLDPQTGHHGVPGVTVDDLGGDRVTDDGHVG